MARDRPTIVIENLAAFRRDLAHAQSASARDLTKAIKVAGDTPLATARRHASKASKSGAHAAGFRVSARGTTGSITNREPYGAKAEWSKIPGFNRYGPPGRFAARAIDEDAETILQKIAEGLKELVTLAGWAR